jgi:hypothetical protein
MSDESNEIPNERMPDEFAAWRRRLQQSDALPEQGLADKEAAWDKLFERMNDRPRRRLFGYRMAAACILILLIPAVRFFQDRPVTGKNHPLLRPVAPLAANPPTRSRAAQPLRTAILPTVTPPAAPQPSAMQLASTRPARTLFSRLPVNRRLPARSGTNEPAIITISAPVLVTTTPPPVAAPSQKPAPKKQWKVVDLNDLDPGHSRPHEMATNRQPPLLHIEINLSTQNR